MTLFLESDSLQSTESFAAQLGANLRGGEVLALQSDVGGGKTAFVRGLARGMGSPDQVASPTFTLSRQYQASSGLTLYHFDFYRLNDPGIMSNELAELVDDQQAVIAIEWGGIVADVIPAAHIVVEIVQGAEHKRDITLTIPRSMHYVVAGLQI